MAGSALGVGLGLGAAAGLAPMAQAVFSVLSDTTTSPELLLKATPAFLSSSMLLAGEPGGAPG